MRHEPREIALGEPVMAHSSQHTVLTMRPPTGRDFRLAGYPFRMKGGSEDGEMISDAGVISKLISMLCGVPLSTVDQLEAADWQACYTALAGFLARTKSRTSSTATSNKPDGGETPDTSGDSASET